MMEVRCCCDAGKLLGWLPTPKALSVMYPIPDEILTFETETVHLGFGQHHYVALKSNDYPIEKLRQIREFVEANEHEVKIGEDQPVDCPAGRAIYRSCPTVRWSAYQPISGPPGSERRRSYLGTRGVRK